MPNFNTQFHKDVSELLIDLSLLVNKLGPNPLAAIAAIDIFEKKLSYQYIFNIEYEEPINLSNDVRDFYYQLEIFFKELNLYSSPDVIISALEITKYTYILEVERLVSGKKR